MLLPRKEEEIRKDIHALRNSTLSWVSPEGKMVQGIALLAEVILDKEYPTYTEEELQKIKDSL